MIYVYATMHPSLQYEINRWQLKTGHRVTTELIGNSSIYDKVNRITILNPQFPALFQNKYTRIKGSTCKSGEV